MADETHTFTQARTRLEEIVTQVRKKDVSLEKSLDLLEEGVRLANICTELSDHTEWRSVVSDEAESAEDAVHEELADDGETVESHESGQSRESMAESEQGTETAEEDSPSSESNVATETPDTA